MQKFIRFFLIFSVLLLAAIFRFGYLNWGYPFFFHPDENNIINAISKLSLSQWNPHFFAYGGFPIYFTFLLSYLVSFGQNNYAVIAYTLRFISATLSFLLIPSLFYIGKKMFSQEVGVIAALLSSVSVGLIQFAHFGTFEMWITFLILWLFYAVFLLYKHPSYRQTVLTGILAGALLSVKVSGLIFLILPLGVLFLQKKKTKFLLQMAFYTLIVFVVYMLTNPYLFIDTVSFISALSYESSVAIGTLPVFYTQSFIGTIPVVFQLLHVFPFLLNAPIYLLFIISFFSFLWNVKKWKFSHMLLVAFFCFSFFSQAFLFVKWTRYMVPTLPFIYIFIALFLSKLKKYTAILVVLSFLISVAFAFIFFLLVYPKNSLLAAENYAAVFSGQKAIVEPYDLGAIAFTRIFSQGTLVNFYDLETDRMIQQSLNKLLGQNSIFLSPSQRLIHTRLQNQKTFPKGYMLYMGLLNGTLGYHIAYQTPCNFLCTLVYLGNPITGSIEETATTFDHPFVTIFSKE